MSSAGSPDPAKSPGPDSFAIEFGGAAASQAPRRIALLLAPSLLAAALVALVAANALGATSKTGEFGGSGSGNGQFSTTAGVAVNESNGHVYAIDKGNARVQEFDADGNFQSMLVPGGLPSPEGIAIDQSSGNFYVTDSTARAVAAFNSGGSFVSTIGGPGTGHGAFQDLSQGDNIAVDSSGNIYVVDSGQNYVHKFDSSGSFQAAIGEGVLSDARTVAIDPVSGLLHVGDGGFGVVNFTAGGAPNDVLVPGPGVGGSTIPEALAFDPGGNAYVYADNTDSITKYDSSRTALETFGGGMFSGTSGTRNSLDFGNGVATLYASDGANDRVLMFGAGGPAPPSIGAESHNLKGGEAAVNAEANPNSSEITDCRFEWGTDTSYGNNVPCDPMPAGEGTNPIPVSADLLPLQELTTYHWRVVAENAEGETEGSDQSFTTGDLPETTMGAVTDVTGRTATFEGAIDPEGNPTTFQFQASHDGFQTSMLFPPTPGDVGSGTSPVTVTTDAAGLIPNAAYEVRLLAHTPAVGGTSYSGPVAFTTPPVPPTVVRYGTSTAGEGYADLRGVINPENAATTYYFEYGPDTSYGSRAPIPDGDAGGSFEPTLVSERIIGLDANATYHYRVVAENLAGTDVGPDRTVTTLNDAGLPDNRAYEMVTPPFKAGYAAAGSAAAASGDAFIFDSIGAFGDVISAPATSTYYAVREVDGWSTTNVSPPVDVGGELQAQGGHQAFTADLSQAFVTGSTLTAESPVGVSNLFRQELPRREFTLLTSTIGDNPSPNYIPELAAFSDDAKRVFIQTGHNTGLCCGLGNAIFESIPETGEVRPVGVLPDRYQKVTVVSPHPPGEAGGTFTLSFDGRTTDPIAFDASRADVQAALEALPNIEPSDVNVSGGPTSSSLRPYDIAFGEDYVNTDTPKLVGDGTGLDGTDAGVLVADALLPEGRFGSPGGETKLGMTAGFRTRLKPSTSNPAALSADGTRAIWGLTERRAPQQNEIFLRDTGSSPARTLEPSASQGGPDATGERPAWFWASDNALSKIFFVSAGRLTPDANTGSCGIRGCDGADLYRFDVDTSELTDLTPVATGAGAQVLGVVRASDDASRVYFAAEGVLAPGGMEGQRNIYLWEDDGSPKGTIRFVASVIGSSLWNEGLRPPSDITPDGRFLAFVTTESLAGYDSGGVAQVYVFDAEADEGSPEQIRCASCNPRGDAPLGGATIGSDKPLLEQRYLLEDGSRLFFETEDALVPTDTNEDTDVYEYDVGADQVSLITTGSVAPGVRQAFNFAGASADGESVFFETATPLLSKDVDEVRDVYVARVGGGFREAPPETECEGDECQGEPSSPPPEVEVGGTAGAAGPGNLDADGQRCQRLVNRFQALKQRFQRLKLLYQAADTRAERRRIARRTRLVKQRAIRVRQAAIECRENL